MQRRDIDAPRPDADQVTKPVGAGHVRFRTESEPDVDPMRRRWQAIHTHGQGAARFQIRTDLGRNTCTISRTADSDYTALLRELAGKTSESVTPVPPPTRRTDSLTFDIDINGLKLPKVASQSAAVGPAGDWLVVQVYLPGSTEWFLLGISDRQGAGEIFVPKAEAGPVVLHALNQVFG